MVKSFFCGTIPFSHKTTSFTFISSVKVWGLNALWISHQNQGSGIWVWVTPLFPVTMCYTSSALSSSHSVSNSNVIAVCNTIKCQDNLKILIFPWQRWTPLRGSGSVWSELRFSCVQGILLVSMVEEVKVVVEAEAAVEVVVDLVVVVEHDSVRGILAAIFFLIWYFLSWIVCTEIVSILALLLIMQTGQIPQDGENGQNMTFLLFF